MKLSTKKLARSLLIIVGVLVIFAAIAVPTIGQEQGQGQERTPLEEVEEIARQAPGSPLEALNPGGALTEWILLAAMNILGWFLALMSRIVTFFLSIVQWLIDPTTFRFTDHPVVILGWRYLRDIVNMGLVLGMIVIAIGFILRMQTYGSQRTLVRLIAVAILVNFSLAIAGVFIDASSILTRAIIGERNLSTEIAIATNFNQLADARRNLLMELEAELPAGENNPQNNTTLPSDLLGETGRKALNSLFMLPFMAVFTVTMGALVIMLIIRMAWLWFLLMIAPLAWFSWIFPSTENYWRDWWHKFLQWTFFVPLVIFFLVLSLRIASPFETQAVVTFTQIFTQYMIAIVLIVLSMIAAQRSGIAFADTGVKWATAAARMPDRFLARRATNLGSLSARSIAQSQTGKNLQKYFAKTRLFGGMSDRIEQLRNESNATIEKQKERIVKAGLSPKEIEELSKRRGTKESRVAMALAAAEHKKFAADPSEGGLTQEERQRYLAIAQSHNRKSAMKVLAADPLLSEHYDETYGEIHGKVGGISGMMRMLGNEDMDALANNPKALENPEVIQSLLGRPQHLKRLVEKVSTANLQTLQSGFAKLKQAIPNMSEGIQDEFNKIAKNPWLNQHLNLGGPIATHAQTPKIIKPGDPGFRDLDSLGNPVAEINRSKQEYAERIKNQETNGTGKRNITPVGFNRTGPVNPRSTTGEDDDEDEE